MILRTNQNLKLLKLSLLFFYLLVSLVGKATIYTVTSTADAGAGTLRQAITDANTTIGLDTIRFTILVPGNTFEISGVNSWAVIQINTVLPTITDPVLIDGSSQTNTNTGSMSGRMVGADSITQASIPYPDVYLVPSATFAFPTTNTNVLGDGLTINAPGVTIRGLCISGFGNTNTGSSNSSHHADVVVARAAAPRNINFTIYNCFLSSDPRGSYPALISGSTRRRTKGGSIVVGGNNDIGLIRNNYMAYAGTYHIHFNGNFDHMGVGPASTTLRSRLWTVEENILLFNGRNALVTSGKAADAINMMRCERFKILKNYIEDSEQVGIDMGYNSDDNYVANNTVTGMVNTTASAPLVGSRVALGSQRDTLYRNAIYNNAGTTFKGGIWIDRTGINTNTVVVQDNSYNLILENFIYNNNASGVVISDNPATVTVAALYNTISRNSIYGNAGLGIDLGFPTAASPGTATNVTVNDNGDADAGVNDLQNFPMIDSAILFSNAVHVWGKGPAGSTMEFFLRDGQVNQFNGRSFNYGEGKKFIGSAVEGSASDLVAATGSYNVDGNVAVSNVNRYYFILPYSGGFNPASDSITSTATFNGNTSEFGPKNFNLTVLDCFLQKFTGTRSGEKTVLAWKALCDKNFAYFLLEHSIDGRTFLGLGKVYPAAADSLNYSFSHLTGAVEKNYYRLKMVSNNNTYKYSHVIAIGSAGQNSGISIKAMENPFHNRLPILMDAAAAEEVQVNIISANGRVVASKSIRVAKGKNQVAFNELSFLAAGYYQIVVDTQDNKISIPVMKQ